MNSYTLDINTQLKANEYTIIEFNNSIHNLIKLFNISFNTTPLSTLTTDYRWSKDGDTWTEWKPWPAPNAQNAYSEFTWLGFRTKSNINILLTSMTIEWSGGELGEDGHCSCTVTSCGSNGDNSFLTSCNTSALYNTALNGVS